jgi:signal transduction histidine kinase
MIKISRLVLFLSFFIYPLALFPQEKEQDTRIVLADSLFEAGQFDQAIAIYQEFIDSRGRITGDEKEAVSLCYLNIGLCYHKMEAYEDAIKWFLVAADLQKETGDREALSNTLNNIGLCYKKLGNYEKAIDYYEQTVVIDKADGNVAEMAKTYNNIGMIYRAWGKYDKAIDYFQKSLAIKKNLQDRAGASRTLNNMGLVYTEWKKYDLAISLLRESYYLEDSLDNESESAIRLNNLGRVFFFMQQYDTALSYFEKSLVINQKNNEKSQMALAYNNIGKVYQAKGQLMEAESYFSSALSLFSELGMESEKSTVVANLGNISQLSGDSRKAISLLDSSTALAVKLNLRNQLEHNYRNLSDIYSGLGNFEKSLDYYKLYSAIKDSIFTKETLSQLSDFQAKYEKEKDQAKILALEKENLSKTIQRNAYLFVGLGIMIIALFVIVYFRQRAVKIKLIADQKIFKIEEEKKLMAARLLAEGQEEERKRIATELHDGLGVLLSATKMQFAIIHDKSPENKAAIEKATRMLDQANHDVRKISHNMMPGLLTKLGFFDAVEDLFDQINDTGELKAALKISGEQERLAENREIMLYRIIQELVNNTLKHAGASHIELQISIEPGMMNLSYADDGKGFDFTAKIESKSIGLQSIQSRVNFLNGKLDVIAEPGKGVKYSIQVPA